MAIFEIESVGYVSNGFDEAVDSRLIKEQTSIIHIYPRYEEALFRIEENEFLDIIYYFHKTQETQLQSKTKSGNIKGVFASRSPMRVSRIALCQVRLIERQGTRLLVQGLDALNGSPVLDIKCSDTSLFANVKENNPEYLSTLKRSPRIEIQNHIFTGRTDLLMTGAAQMHGHYCPGLAMGVMAATHAMKWMQHDSDGMEDLLAITEINNCFSDGVQFVTGCTFGNNALIYEDLGKTAFTLCKRDGRGLRISVKPESGEVIRKAFPDFNSLYDQVVVAQHREPELLAAYKKSAMQRAFGTLGLAFDDLFGTQEVQLNVPDYAATKESEICSVCGESVMSTRTVLKDGLKRCLTCAGETFGMMDGNGIHTVRV